MSEEQSLRPVEDFETGMAFMRSQLGVKTQRQIAKDFDLWIVQVHGADENGYECVHKLTTEIGLPWDSAYEEEVTALARAAYQVWSRLTHD